MEHPAAREAEAPSAKGTSTYQALTNTAPMSARLELQRMAYPRSTGIVPTYWGLREC